MTMEEKAEDLIYLHRCAQLADLATGQVLDNPRVGAVLVHRKRIIGEGYHQRAGEAHAEVHCLRSVRPEDRQWVSAATLYISLEPCCVTGRTGACTDLIRRNGIRTVVFAQRDTTPGVNGESVAILRGEGITVREYPDFVPTIRANAHRRLLTLTGRPQVVLKYARSADGFLRPADRTRSYWITSPFSRRLVHRWRAATSAILVGGRTVVEDDPALTTRLFPGPNPRVVVLDLRNRVTGKEKIFAGSGEPPLVFASRTRPALNAEVVVLAEALDKGALTQVLSALAKRRLGQVIVEGGAVVLEAFLSAGYWDEARVFTGRARLGAGVVAPVPGGDTRTVRTSWIGTDRLDTYTNPAMR